MMKLLKSYLSIRRSAGFRLRSVEYQLQGFCKFAAQRRPRYTRAPI
jgi:hypothetical protein